MTTVLVNCHKTDYHKDIPYDVWTTSNDHVYIGRWKWYIQISSKWRNKFTERYGSIAERIRLYADWINSQPQLLAALPELKNKILGCWCVEKPIDYVREEKVCHGEILLDLLEKKEYDV